MKNGDQSIMDVNLEQYEREEGKNIGKHTPGPWKAEKMLLPTNEKDRRSGIVINGPEPGGEFPTRICDMRCDQEKGFVEMRANAALITAAPELLEACIFALECAEGPIPGMTLTAAVEKVCRLLDNAIAKAKGN